MRGCESGVVGDLVSGEVAGGHVNGVIGADAGECMGAVVGELGHQPHRSAERRPGAAGVDVWFSGASRDMQRRDEDPVGSLT
ncbi:hypothetical protein, partial [Cellulomonas carbonis]|uniref:hypothetical protein n=1 Tax=Cellulomonas carbonis TaxID=1386092 RepID=UPI001F2CDBAE